MRQIENESRLEKQEYKRTLKIQERDECQKRKFFIR
jgi:hypothetical protein